MAISRSRRGDLLIPLLTVACDALAIEFSFLLSYWLRFRSSFFDSLGFVQTDAPPIQGYWLGSLLIIPIWLMMFNSRGMYGARRSVTLSDEFINIIKVVSLGMLIVMSAAFFYRDFSYSRVVFALLWLTSISFLTAGRVIIHSFERHLYHKGKNVKYAIVVGGDTRANEVYVHLNHHPSFGFNILGYFADAAANEELALRAAPHLGSLAEAATYIRRENIELAFIAIRSEDHAGLFQLISECEGVNVEFLMVPDILEILTSQMKIRELEGIPFVQVKNLALSQWGRITKRAFDIVVSSILLLLLTPVALLITLLIRLDSRGPALFRQERIGLDGKRFSMYKFRSMKVGSESFDDRAGLGIRDDPRRTRIGVFLRKFSLDELPQLFNVLRGDMSLVGPRPERAKYVEEFREEVPKYLDRHRMKAGVTGWAQVNGLRGDTPIKERVKYDLYYIENWSFTFDIKILLRTLRATLSIRQVE